MRGFALLMACLGVGCAAAPPTPIVAPVVRPKILSFLDGAGVTALAERNNHLWIGTTHGLLSIDLASHATARFSSRDGLPEGRVGALAVSDNDDLWIAVGHGLSHLAGGQFHNVVAPPVGEFVSALAWSSGTLWASGPEGIARLDKAGWVRALPGVPVNALSVTADGALWGATAGKGAFRVVQGAAQIFGVKEGLALEVVRSIAASPVGVVAIGEGPNGARVAWFDGTAFHSYRCDKNLLWAQPHGQSLWVASEDRLYELVKGVLDKAIPLQPTAGPTVSLSLLERRGLPPGVSTTANAESALVVGTRAAGVLRLSPSGDETFHIGDITKEAERLTVACEAKRNDCYVATGGRWAWRFDGKEFDEVVVDPEPGARVLAMLPEGGGVIVIHRGRASPELRISRAGIGQFAPIAMQTVKVPSGVPLLNFAEFAPDGHLWIGLRYQDQAHDWVDWGAAEIALETGKVIYYHQGGKSPPLPNDAVAAYWHAMGDAWFATRSGVAHLVGGKLKVFTENDGLEDEIAHDIGPGPNGEVWIATHHGVGRFDGATWKFPTEMPFGLNVTSLGHDDTRYFLGTEKGLQCVGACAGFPLDGAHGLPDDMIADVQVDRHHRIWVLSASGISVVYP